VSLWLNLLITHQVFTGRLLILLQLLPCRGSVLPTTDSILILCVVLRCTWFYSHSLWVVLQLLNLQFEFYNLCCIPLYSNCLGSYLCTTQWHRLSLYNIGSDPMENTSRVIKNDCLLVRYLVMDVFLLLRANFGNVPSGGSIRHNTYCIFSLLIERIFAQKALQIQSPVT
jgi:hypothetical protein